MNVCLKIVSKEFITPAVDVIEIRSHLVVKSWKWNLRL